MYMIIISKYVGRLKQLSLLKMPVWLPGKLLHEIVPLPKCLKYLVIHNILGPISQSGTQHFFIVSL